VRPRNPGRTADGDAIRAALDGISTVLMVSASETSDRVDLHRRFVDAAAAAGVAHLVYISFYGAEPNATFSLARDHWHTEQHIRERGLTFTFLRERARLNPGVPFGAA
jgi:NAD(P)H dehydrogenase (quinone)